MLINKKATHTLADKSRCVWRNSSTDKLWYLLIAFGSVNLFIYWSFPNHPYFYSVYDSEAEYFSGSMEFLSSYTFTDFYHPGLTIKLIGSIVIKLLSILDKNNLDTIILVYRTTIFLLGAILLIVLIKNESPSTRLLIWTFAILLPQSYHLSLLVSPHWVSISLALWLYYSGYSTLGSNTTLSGIKYGLIASTCIYTNLLLLIIIIPTFYLQALICRIECNYRSILISTGILVFASIPIVLFAPLYPGLYFSPELKKIITSSAFLSLVAIVTLGALAMFTFSFVTSIKVLDAYQYLFMALGLACFSVLMSQILSKSNSFDDYMESRAFLFAGIFIFLVLNKLREQPFYHSLIVLSFLAMMVFTVRDLKAKDLESHELSEKMDVDFNLAIELLRADGFNSTEIYLMPTSRFVSRTYFVTWSSFRYGAKALPPRYDTLLYDKRLIKIYPFRGINQSAPSDSFGYRYLTVLSESRLGSILGWPKVLKNDHNKIDRCTLNITNESITRLPYMIVAISSRKPGLSSWNTKDAIEELLSEAARIREECRYSVSNSYDLQTDYLTFSIIKITPIGDKLGI